MPYGQLNIWQNIIGIPRIIIVQSITPVNSFFLKKTDHIIDDKIYTETTETIALGTIYSIALFVRNEAKNATLMTNKKFLCFRFIIQQH